MKEQFPFREEERIVQKARRQSRRRMIGTTVITLLSFLIIGGMLKWQWTAYGLHEKAKVEEAKSELYGGNRHMSPIETNNHLFQPSQTAYRYALLQQIPIETRQVEVGASNRLYFEPTPYARYDIYGTKQMMFFPPNEKGNLNDEPMASYQEAAVSLTHPMRYEDIQQALPKEVIVHWIGPLERIDEPVVNDETLGIALRDKAGELYEEPLRNFLINADILKKKKIREHEEVAKQAKRINRATTIGEIETYGLVIEADRATLQQMKQLPFVHTMSYGIGKDE